MAEQNTGNKCPRCGNVLEAGTVVCPKCGYSRLLSIGCGVLAVAGLVLMIVFFIFAHPR